MWFGKLIFFRVVIYIRVCAWRFCSGRTIILSKFFSILRILCRKFWQNLGKCDVNVCLDEGQSDSRPVLHSKPAKMQTFWHKFPTSLSIHLSIYHPFSFHFILFYISACSGSFLLLNALFYTVSWAQNADIWHLDVRIVQTTKITCKESFDRHEIGRLSVSKVDFLCEETSGSSPPSRRNRHQSVTKVVFQVI